MSGVEWDSQALREPITAERPCGDSLEDVHPLVTLDALRLFGRSRSPDAPPEPNDTKKPPDWGEVRTLSLEGLGRSKDLRLLAYLATAGLRTDGLLAFLDTLAIASRWLESYWTDVHPLVDDDAIARRNALNCFADSMAVLERLRRTPVVESRAHGKFGLRDIDIATGHLQPGAGEPRPEPAAIDAAFAEMTTESLASLHAGATGAVDAVRRIDARMREEGGADMAPSFEPLTAQLVKLRALLEPQLALRQESVAEEPSADAGAAPGAAGKAVPGAIASRQDALRALDAVADYFRHNEPSSPVPLLLERAKRLVSKDFLEVLAEIAPEALPGARAVGGLRDS